MTTTTETLRQDFPLEQLRSLYSLVKSLNEVSRRDDTATVFLEKLKDIVTFDTCAVMLGGGYSGDYEITHAAGEHAASLIGRRIVSGEGVSGWVMANRHRLCNTDPRLDLPPSLSEEFASCRTLSVFPILNGNILYGTIALYSSSPSEYDTTQQQLITEAVGLLALAFTGLDDGTKSNNASTIEMTSMHEPSATSRRFTPRYSAKTDRTYDTVN